MAGEEARYDFEELKKMIANAEAGAREEAIGELITSFEKHVRRLARQMLSQRLRRLLSTEDVLSSVCIRLVTGLREGNVQLRTEEEFIKLLRVMTQNIVRDKHAYDTAGKRDSRRQRSLTPGGPDDTAVDGGLAVPDPGTPTPSFQVREEERRQILGRLYAEVERLLQADEWHLYKRRYIEGAELAVIGAEFGLGPDAVRMRLKRINEGLREKLKPYAEYLDKQG
jgi:RNA polymerase sigma factor (sigma-70 family)